MAQQASQCQQAFSKPCLVNLISKDTDLVCSIYKGTDGKKVTLKSEISTKISLYDYFIIFQIYNGSMSEEALIGKYCGTIEPLVVITHLVLFVEFISDGSVNGHGFNATYFHVSGM